MLPLRCAALLWAAIALQGAPAPEYPKNANEAQERHDAEIAKAEAAEKASTARGFAALDEARIHRELAAAYDEIASLFRREETLAKERQSLTARREAAGAAIARELTEAARTPTKPSAVAEGDLEDASRALERARSEWGEIGVRLARAQAAASGGELAIRERIRATNDDLDAARRALQLGTTALGPAASALESQRIALVGRLQERTLAWVVERETLAPAQIAVLGPERDAKKLEAERLQRDLTTLTTAYLERLAQEKSAADQELATLRARGANANDPPTRALLEEEIATAQLRVDALDDRLDTAATLMGPLLSDRLVDARARFEALGEAVERIQGGHASVGLGGIYPTLQLIMRSGEVQDLRDGVSDLRKKAARARATTVRSLQTAIEIDVGERADRERLLANATGLSAAERESLGLRFHEARAARLAATRQRALAASRRADLAEGRVSTIERLLAALEEAQSFARSRALFVRVPSQIGTECVVRAAADGVAALRSAPALLSEMGSSAAAYVGRRENLPTILLAAVLLPGAFALVFVTRRLALRIGAKLPTGAELSIVERTQRLAVGVARRMAMVGFVVLAVVIGVQLFAAPPALVRAVNAAAVVVVLVRLAQVLLVATLRPDEARLRLLPVSDATARYVCRIGLLASLALLAVAIPRQVLEAVGYGARNPDFIELLVRVERTLLIAAIIVLFLRPKVLADLLPKGEYPAWKVLRGAVLRLRPIILFFALAILALRFLGYGNLAGFLESISAGGVVIAILTSLGHKAAVELWGRFAPSMGFGGAGSDLARDRRRFLDRFVRTLSAIVFCVLAYLAFSAILRVGEDDLRGIGVGVVGGRRFTVIDLLRFALVLAATGLLASWVRKWLELFILPLTQLEIGTRFAVAVMSSYLVIVAGVFAALESLGLELRDFAILLGAAGFGIGLGLQEVAANYMGGVTLLLSRPVKVGDVIETEGRIGTVNDISLTSTVLQTAENYEIRVPNREIVGRRLINYTGSDPKVRGACSVRVPYGIDLEKAKKALVEAARQVPGVLPAPPPAVMLLGFQGSAVNLDLQFWMLVRDRLQVESAVRFAVLPALAGAGIDAYTPRQEITLRGPVDLRREDDRG